MNSLWVAAASIGALLVGYAVYGRFIAVRLLRADAWHKVPSGEPADGVDYAPTRVSMLFGRHFGSMAGLGPVLGPAIAVTWGWLPAVLWIVLGAILAGGVHDLCALVISARHPGQSLGGVAGAIIGRRGRLLFVLVIFLVVAIAMGVFAREAAKLLVYEGPDAVIPLFAVMILAAIVGLASHKLGLALWAVTGVALVLMVAAICVGVRRPVPIYPVFLPAETQAEYDKATVAASEGKQWFLAERGMPDLLTEAEMKRRLAEYQEPRPVPRLLRPELPASFARYIYATGEFDMEEHVLGRVSDEDQAVRLTEGAAGKARTMWTLVLLACAFVAAVLPRWLLLEPRNYLNSFVLYGGMGLMVLGLVVLRPAVAAPAMRGGSADGPGLSLVPLLLVSIAGGAVSGLHAVVGAGSTAGQLDNERHARLIGYGGMVGEAVLAVLVVLACSAAVACLSGESVARAGSDEEARERWLGAYGSPGDTERSALGTVVRGGAVLISQAGLLVADNGIPLQPAVAFASLVVLSFAVTALDAGARLLRHNIEELASGDGLRFMGNRFVAAGLGVLAMAPFAFSNAGLSLWHLLGASNLLLAALVLLVATVYLFKRGAWIWYTALPMVVVGAVAIWALGIKLRDFAAAQEWGLLALVIALLCLALWLAVEGAIAWRRAARDGPQRAGGLTESSCLGLAALPRIR